MRSNNRSAFLAVSFFVILFSLAGFLYAGSAAAGIIKGKISAEDGTVLYGAHVSLPSINRGTITGKDGEFIIKNVPAGTYRIAVSYLGYESQIKTITLGNGLTVETNFNLSATTIQTESVVVTGNPYAVNPLDSPQDVTAVSGREKLKSEAASLGKTLESLPGIYSLSAGSVAGKPVVRGHTSERVLILSDGMAQEYQQYGERHSPNIESFNYERIEVVKGAASLLYGSDAMGGAVNLIPHPFHFSQGSKPELSGDLAGGYYSNNNEYMTGLKLKGATENYSFNGSIIRRKADNFNTPGEATYSETGQRGDPKFTGEIPNTNFEQLNGSAGIGYLSPIGIFSADFDHYMNKNNFLLPNGNPIGLRLINSIVNVKGNIPFNKFIIKPKFSYQRNHRQATKGGLNYETLPDAANVDLILDVYTARVEVENIDMLGLSGTTGAEVKHYDHENVGSVPLQPTGHFTNYALFLFEEWRRNKLTLNFGARADYRDQLFYGTDTNPLLTEDDSRDYFNVSGSFGIAYKLTDQLTAAGNVSRGFRTPSFYNLYVYGEHGGVFAFQIGNPDLDNETSLDLSASLRFKNKFLNAEATFFHNMIDNYIYLYSAPDHPLAPEGQAFVFAHDQADAAMTGVELSADISFVNWLLISGSYSTINSEFTSGAHDEDELPLMPPDRLMLSAKVLLPAFSFIKSPYFSVNAKFVSSKDAAGIYEPFGQFDDGIGPDLPFGVCSTDSYNLIGLACGFDLALYSQPINVDLEVTNLLDEDYRDFLDTYKGYALSPGRSINLKLNVPFTFN
ncbi:MAG: TonB-dependent receptor [Ignavibacteria bacterium]|jgi:iron complex outermembrane receptor protein/hemoglobin/transferrin/lactoferrin receptor protein